MRLLILCNNIKEYRLKFGLSQLALSQKLGVSKTTISAWECGDFSPGADMACLLCKVFSCEFKDLFYLSEV